MDNNEPKYKIDLIEVLQRCLKHWWLFLICVVLFSLVGTIYKIYFVDETYTASGVIYVSSAQANNDQSTEDAASKGDLDMARRLSDTYTETLKIRSFLMEVSNNVNNKYSWKQIRNMMTVETLEETELISIRVTAYFPKDAYDITKNILDLAPEKLEDVTGMGKVKVIDDVVMPDIADDKNTASFIFICAVLGCVFAAGIVMLELVMDKKIHKVEDLVKRYEISVLGTLR